MGHFYCQPNSPVKWRRGLFSHPFFFSIYLLPLGFIFRKHGVSFHCYADDTQIYLRLKRNKDTALKSLFTSLEEVKMWFSQFLIFE